MRSGRGPAPGRGLVTNAGVMVSPDARTSLARESASQRLIPEWWGAEAVISVPSARSVPRSAVASGFPSIRGPWPSSGTGDRAGVGHDDLLAADADRQSGAQLDREVEAV
jgi:hypothetical protein